MNVERAQKPVIAHFVKSAECGSGGGGCCCLFSHRQPLALVFFFVKIVVVLSWALKTHSQPKTNKQTEKNRARSLQLRMQLG